MDGVTHNERHFSIAAIGLGMLAVSPIASAEPYEIGRQVPQLLLSLGLVIVVIFALGWVSRRFVHFRPTISNAQLRIVAGLSVGPRERIVVVQAGEQQLLVGLSPGRIETLHVFAEPVIEAKALEPGSFANALRGVMQKKTGAPLS